MSISGKDILTAANKCMELQSEAGFRSAISRAYYALYHETCSALKHCPPTTHEGVVQYLLTDARRKNEPYVLTDLVSVGAVLRQQKTKRKLADYQLEKEVLESEASASITAVKKILSKIDGMRKP